ncbi:hypothetical protein LguiB_012775 [Lonicera macranthoides]
MEIKKDRELVEEAQRAKHLQTTTIEEKAKKQTLNLPSKQTSHKAKKLYNIVKKRDSYLMFNILYLTKI